MRKFILTSPKFEGAVTFGYNADNRLIYYENTTSMTIKQLDWLLANLPQASTWIGNIKTDSGTRVVEIPEDLSFERFWNLYDKKVNRLRAEPLFEKLNEAEKFKAIMRVKTYKEYCHLTHRGVSDPEKYIRSKYFETDWDKVRS